MILLTTATASFLTHYSKGKAPQTILNMRHILGALQRRTQRVFIGQITPADIDSLCAHLHPSDVGRVAIFHRWVTNEYPGEAFVFHKSLKPTQRPLKILGTDYNAVVAEVDGLRLRLDAPHERLLFLCGFWYDIRLGAVRRLSYKDLYALPQRREFYDLIARVYRFSQTEPVFKTWMASCRRSASYYWAGISGGTSFSKVVLAGNVAKGRLGIRTPLEPRAYHLPVLSDETLARLPVPWADLRESH